MATWAVTREKLELLPFPDPETTKLELAKAGSYMLVVGKGIFQNGQTVIVVPSNSVLPDNIADEGDRRKYLSGPNKNRVKSIKLRGELSNAIVLDDKPEFADIPIGQDISEQLNITQWQPIVPAQLVGKVKPTGNIDTAGRELTHHDCEQFLIYESEFNSEESVIVTEKLHGSQICLIRTVTGKELVSSKGIFKRGLVIEEDVSNTYWRAVKNCDPFLLMRALYPNSHVQVFGEVVPCQAGFDYGQVEPVIFYFRIEVDGQVIPYDQVPDPFKERWAPVLYQGKFDKAKFLELRQGNETVSGQQRHLKEGLVISPAIPRKSSRGGFPLYLKLLNPKYRESGDEFN